MVLLVLHARTHSLAAVLVGCVEVPLVPRSKGAVQVHGPHVAVFVDQNHLDDSMPIDAM
jgi:hypothetical protein